MADLRTNFPPGRCPEFLGGCALEGESTTVQSPRRTMRMVLGEDMVSRLACVDGLTAPSVVATHEHSGHHGLFIRRR